VRIGHGPHSDTLGLPLILFDHTLVVFSEPRRGGLWDACDMRCCGLHPSHRLWDDIVTDNRSMIQPFARPGLLQPSQNLCLALVSTASFIYILLLFINASGLPIWEEGVSKTWYRNPGKMAISGTATFNMLMLPASCRV